MDPVLKIGNPFLIQFNLLTKCIFNCSYCYLNKLGKSSDKILGFGEYCNFLEKFSKYHDESGLNLSLNLTGGDLWFHPELESIFGYTNELDFVTDISLLINNLWHPESRRLILSIKDKLSCVQLNIDSLVDREDDLLFLEANNVPNVVKILISKNQPYFDYQIKTLKTLRKSIPGLKVSIDRLCPTTTDQIGQIASSGEVIEKIDQVIKLGVELFIVDDPLISALYRKRELSKNPHEDAITGCVINGSGMSVYPDGSIKLCSRLPDFNTGYTIKNYNLIEYVKAFSNILSAKTKKCHKCKLVEVCNGGCPATSYLSNDRELGLDINCLRKYAQ